MMNCLNCFSSSNERDQIALPDRDVSNQANSVNEMKKNAIEFKDFLQTYENYLMAAEKYLKRLDTELTNEEKLFCLARVAELQISVSSTQLEILFCVAADILKYVSGEDDKKKVENLWEGTNLCPIRTFVESGTNSSDEMKINQAFERVYSNNNRVYLTNLKLQRLADTIFQKLDQKMIPNPNPIQSSQANRADVLNELESHKNELEGLRQVLMEFERNNGWRCQISSIEFHSRKLIDYQEIIRKSAISISKLPFWLNSSDLRMNESNWLSTQYINDSELKPDIQLNGDVSESIKATHEFFIQSIMSVQIMLDFIKGKVEHHFNSHPTQGSN